MLQAFPCLYKELTTVSASTMLSSEQCFNFVSKDVFKKSVLDKVMLDELLSCCKQYPREIEQILQLSLKKFAHSFAYQKGAIFGFGENADDDTGSVLKISALK